MAQLNIYNCLICNELYCAAYYSDNCFDAIENVIARKRIESRITTNVKRTQNIRVHSCEFVVKNWRQ